MHTVLILLSKSFLCFFPAYIIGKEAASDKSSGLSPRKYFTIPSSKTKLNKLLHQFSSQILHAAKLSNNGAEIITPPVMKTMNVKEGSTKDDIAVPHYSKLDLNFPSSAPKKSVIKRGFGRR